MISHGRARSGKTRGAEVIEMKKMELLLFALLFMSPMALSAQSREIPTPESVIGFKPGSDNKLATYEEVIRYFKKLASSSRHVQLLEAGKTTTGRTAYFAAGSSRGSHRRPGAQARFGGQSLRSH
jgi:hypothetical protein